MMPASRTLAIVMPARLSLAPMVPPTSDAGARTQAADEAIEAAFREKLRKAEQNP